MRILTLNIWGAPYAKQHAARTKLICDRLKVLQPDVILLQEVYLPDNRQMLIQELGTAWTYYQHFSASIIGSGLMTFSRYPIVDAVFHRYRLGGKPERIMQDYYAGKGIGLVRVESPEGMLDVYNSHTHAQYDYWDENNEYAVFNESNLYEAARFIHSQSGANPLVLCGDLNTRPDQAGYRILRNFAQLADSYPLLHGHSDITFSDKNPYVTDENQCLDYVMVKNLGVKSIEIVMNESLAGNAPAYSDHYGLMAELDFEQALEHQSEDKLEIILESFKKRLEMALVEADAEQMQHLEQIPLGLSLIFDVRPVSHFIGRKFPRVARALTWLVSSIGILYALYQAAQAGLNLRARQQALKGLLAEVEHQSTAHRLFDGRKW